MRDQAERLRQLARDCRQRPRARLLNSRVAGEGYYGDQRQGRGGKTNVTVNLALALASLGQKCWLSTPTWGWQRGVCAGGVAQEQSSHLLDGCSIGDVVMDVAGIKFMSGDRAYISWPT
jgi:hypothetical protein